MQFYCRCRKDGASRRHSALNKRAGGRNLCVFSIPKQGEGIKISCSAKMVAHTKNSRYVGSFRFEFNEFESGEINLAVSFRHIKSRVKQYLKTALEGDRGLL